MVEVGHIQLIIGLTAFIISIGTIIWRVAVLDTKSTSTKDALIRVHKRVDDLEATYKHDVEKLMLQMQEVIKSQVRIETQIIHLIKLEDQRHGVHPEGHNEG